MSNILGAKVAQIGIVSKIFLLFNQEDKTTKIRIFFDHLSMVSFFYSSPAFILFFVYIIVIVNGVDR